MYIRYLMSILIVIKNMLHYIKNLYLRLRHGAGCCDVFDLQTYLAIKIIKPLKVFRKSHLLGHPIEFKSQEEWEKIIDEMIWAFEHLLKNDEDKIMEPGKTMQCVIREQKGLELFGKHFKDLWI